MYSSYDLYLDFIESGVGTSHKDLLRTIERLLSHGLQDEIIESHFVNKMGRKYKMYLLSDRVSNMLESLYLFKGFGDNKTEKKVADYSTPDLTYIFSSTNGLYKIGCTNNIPQRLKTVQTGNPDYIEVYAILYGGKNTESRLHKQLEEYRVSGEWFSINEEIIHNEIFKNNRGLFRYGDTLNSILFELYHYGEDDREIFLSDFTDSKDIRVLNKLKKAIKNGMDRKLPYKEIFKYAKEEVEKVIDGLCFRPKLENDN